MVASFHLLEFKTNKSSENKAFTGDHVLNDKEPKHDKYMDGIAYLSERLNFVVSLLLFCRD